MIIMGQTVCFANNKGGVGKTTLTANLAGLYFFMKKKVLIIDLDLYAGGIATILNVDNKKDIYMLVECLLKQDDIILVAKKDYIKNPKKSGYQSLHLIVELPIQLENEEKNLKQKKV